MWNIFRIWDKEWHKFVLLTFDLSLRPWSKVSNKEKNVKRIQQFSECCLVAGWLKPYSACALNIVDICVKYFQNLSKGSWDIERQKFILVSFDLSQRPCSMVSETFTLNIVLMRWKCVWNILKSDKGFTRYGAVTNSVHVTFDLPLWPWCRFLKSSHYGGHACEIF